MNLYSAACVITSILININCFSIPTIEIPVRKLIKRNVVVTNDLLSSNVTENVPNYKNDNLLSSDTIKTTTTTEKMQIHPGNNLLIGQCSAGDQRIYTDDTIVENSGPSTISGTLEVNQ